MEVTDMKFEADVEKPFPIHCFSQSIQKIVVQVADAFMVSQSLVSPVVLGYLSSTLGKGLWLETGHPSALPGCLFVIVGAPPGAGKSEIMKFLAKPIHEAHKKLVKDFRIQIENELVDSDGKPPTKGKLDAACKGKSPKLIVRDATPEALSIALANSGEYLLSTTSEGKGLIDRLRGKKSNNCPEDDFYLACFAGDSYSDSRVMRDEVELDSPRMSIVWACTTTSLSEVASDNRLMDAGFTSRCLFASIDEELRQEFGERPTIEDEVKASWEELLSSLLLTFWANPNEGRKVIASSSSREIVRAFSNKVIEGLNNGSLNFVNKLAVRWREQVWRIALNLHVQKYTTDSANYELSSNTVMNALEIMNWYIGQELGLVYDFEKIQIEHQEIWRRLENYLFEKKATSFRELKRKKIIKKGEESFLDSWIEEKKLIRWNNNFGGGQPSIHYALPDDPCIPEEVMDKMYNVISLVEGDGKKMGMSIEPIEPIE